MLGEIDEQKVFWLSYEQWERIKPHLIEPCPFPSTVFQSEPR
jgi:hypothetical protein